MKDDGHDQLTAGIIPEVSTSFIAGKPVQPVSDDHRIDCIDPANETVISRLVEANADTVGHAVDAARDAFENGPWPRMSVVERKRILLQIRDVILAHADELAVIEATDVGLPIRTVKDMHVPRAAWNFEFFAGYAEQAAGEAYNQTEPYLSYVTREPIGVGALIGPWNISLGLCSMKIASCIAFGNCCVIKPSEYTPLSVRYLLDLIHTTEIPAGVVNLVNGRGAVTGDALAGHAGVDVISFTGGTVTGRRIMARASESLKRVGFELGGKSANIICASANPERALDGALASIFAMNGQLCLAGSRILVERSIADEFIGKFVDRCRSIRLGSPLDPDTELGPLCYEAHMEKVLSYVDIARNEGAELLVGGQRSPAFNRGYYVEPTAVLSHDNSSRVCQEEIFGPFATFLAFDDVDEAIAVANDTEYGLVAYIWSEHLPTMTKLSQGIRAGTIWVNTPMTRELRAPFGGYKQSGVGRDSGRDCMELFTEAKTTTIPTGDFPLPRFGA